MANTINTINVKLNDIRNYILANVDLQLIQRSSPRLYIQGPPGAGKSMIIEEICRENGWALKCQYISNCALEYLTGLPCKVEHGETVRWSKPAILDTANLDYRPDNYEEGKTPTIILFDDFHLCDRVMQRYMFQLLTYKGLNDYQLDNNVAIILAGNRISDKAGAMPIPAPVANRMMFIEVTVDVKDWMLNFAFKNNVRGDIISFLNNKGNAYFSMTPVESTSWASPRSWTFLSNQIDAFEKRFGKNMSLDTLRIIACGEVGNEAAKEFIMYRELFAKWDFDELSKKNIKDVIKQFEEEASKNSTAIYAIISAAVSWMIRVYRENNKDIKNPNVIHACEFTYDTMVSFLTMRIKGVNITPIVLAGTQFIHTYATSDTIGNTKSMQLSRLFLENLTKDRDTDYLFLDIISKIFHIRIANEDKAKIDDVKRKINYTGKLMED